MKHFSTFVIGLLFSLCLLAQTGSQSELLKRLEQHVSVLAADSMEGRGIGTEGTIKARNYIERQFRDIGLLNYDDDYYQEFRFRTGSSWVSGTNIIGWLKGSDPALQNEYIVLGAHYDHVGYEIKDNEKVIYHGADDNASGTATVIELARYFKANPELVKRSLIFCAFDAEESGLIGSKRFVEENTLVADSAIRLMFSIDMVGMLEAYKGLDLKGIGSLTDGVDIAFQTAGQLEIRLKNVTEDIEGSTDTWHFGEKNIPATHVFTGIKSPYHKPEDTWEKLDYDGMAKVAEFMQSLVAELSAQPELVPSQIFTSQQKPAGMKFKAGVTAGMGSSRQKYAHEFYTANSIFAGYAGLFVQVDVGKKFTIQPEVLFQSDGSKSAEGTFRRQSMVVPLNVHFNMVNQYGGLVKAYLLAGGYYLHSFSGKNGDTDLDFDNEFNADGWGVDFGLGTDIKNWQVKSTWNYGITDLSKIRNVEIYPMGWYLSVGYKF